MKSASVPDQDTLQSYLENESFALSRAIAYRAALRAVPAVHSIERNWLGNEIITLFRALLLISIKVDDYYLDISRSVDAALINIAIAGLTPIQAMNGPARISTRAALKSVVLNHNNVHNYAMDAVAQAALFIEDRAWLEANQDCFSYQELSELLTIEEVARRMGSLALWSNRPPVKFTGNWHIVREDLHLIDSNFTTWTNWFERRMMGQDTAFDIPGDEGRIEDKKILRRLAEATNEDFWGKGHEYVNATLKGWLDEARKKVRPKEVHSLQATDLITGLPDVGRPTLEQVTPPPVSLDAIKPDPQDVRSPQFGSDRTGRIVIKADAGTDQLRSDPQSLSRHARALQMAQRLAEALRNHNNAGYMTEMASDYVAAMGSDQDRPDPSGLVFAGDQLREAIAKHRTAGADDDLQPLPPSADRDASAFLSAHNMYVGSDPFLDDLDRTTRGPDTPLPAANPDEIKLIASTAREDDILAEQTYDYMVAASDIAPATYDQNDRHSRFAAGLAQNFARYGVEFLWAYPTETAWAGIAAAGVGAIMTVGLLATGAGAIAGVGIAYHMARNIVANEAVYRKLLAASPAGEDNFNRLIRFLKSSAIKSPKDD